MHLVRLGVPEYTDSRLSPAFKEDEFKEDFEEWVKAAPRNEERRKLLASELKYCQSYAPPAEWTGKPEGWETRLKPIILEMERRAGKVLPKGSNDDCPYPVRPPSI
jgi:hypothetical protein